MNPLTKSFAALLLTAPLLFAQKKTDTPRSEADILKSIKAPDGYTATIFAMPPQLSYPTACAASPDGALFVAVDENGSLGRSRNKPEKPRGYVARLRDTDGDGKADEFKKFAEMESPRGVIWDGPSGTAPGTLYVMYPPKLTAYTDTNGDGVADKQEDILTGLGFDLGFRGADHTTNGCRLGIDGFIYIAVGDYGFTEATAKDGTKLSMRGGGIVRIRPDGTGFEIVSRGQRNIYDVAVSPTLDLFTRDNTNDGGGWNVRLSHVPPGAHMGYPTLFKNFPEDIVPAMADLGGGSPCGALWLDEPGLQNGLYTVEWGRSAIVFHTIKNDGASWKTDGANFGQKDWLKLVRPTDMDVDASGRIYVTSWEGATFDYNGPHAGYILSLSKNGAKPAPVPNLRAAAPGDLVKWVASPSATIRSAAQRELLRRGAKGAAAQLSTLAASATEPGIKTALIETAAQLAGPAEALKFCGPNTPTPARKAAILAVGNAAAKAAAIPTATLTPLLADADPAIRAATVTTLRRLGRADAAQSILPLVADADPTVAHLAVRTLSTLKAAQACLGALDSSDEKTKPGALRALYAMRDAKVVDGLISRLPSAKGEARRGLLNALCRLSMDDAPYTDPKVWWGTRPDTTGPVYQPIAWAETPKIEAALKKALDTSSEDDAAWLVRNMYKTRVNLPGLVELMLAKAGNDTASKLTAIEGLFAADNTLPAAALGALTVTAQDEKIAPDFRARALRLLARASERGAALDAVLAGFAPLAGTQIGHAALSGAFEDFTRDAKNIKHLGVCETLATGTDAAKRTLAQTILVNLATSTLVKGKDKERAEAAVAKCWAKPEAAASLLGVIARTKAASYAEQVNARLKDPNNAVAEAALFAHQALDLGQTGSPAKMIATMKYDEVFAAVQKGGDAKLGRDVYLRAGCIACHTVAADEPPKGPVLSAVAKIYDRAALTESILKPSAKLAQGFESTFIKTKKGELLEGFVTREGGDNLDLRNIAGQTVLVEKADIAERGHREQSMMPEGLMNGLTPADLANLLAWMESLKN